MTNWNDDIERLALHGRDREAAALAVRRLHTDRTTQGAAMGPLEQLDELAPTLGKVIAGVRDDQLDAPTPCTDFAVRDVLDHMIGGATAFAAAFRGEEAPTVAAPGDRRELAGVALGNLVAAISEPGALDRIVASPFGDFPGETFARFVVLDGLVHGWDIAVATGQPYDPPERLVTEVHAFARQAVPPLRGTVFGTETDAPPTATPIQRLAAFTGRTI